ncbi:FG-GAP-like repeat-containing protein [Paenibacillus cymbidii]|uniref:FG-GAP-like repeat-containing protein n=1 Tax=Paenibacillus cymbidii TaxID=1639034 RepID=UPI001436729F|nr:FG-GAP-like repeat-containing protein [Paenibacillus cymbidii]
MKKKLLANVLVLSIACGSTAGAAPVTETVNYSGFTGFTSVTYTSEFLGYQAAMNRDFTNYGFDFDSANEKDDVMPIVWSTADMRFRLADVDGDGLDDALYYNVSSGSLKWFRSVGDGTFGSVNNVTWNDGKNSGFLAADFNGDGYADLGALKVAGSSATITIAYGNGAGAFSGTTVATGVAITGGQLEAADVDGDKHADIIVYTGSTGAIDVWFGDGAGGFPATHNSTWSNTTNPGTLVVGDLNQDRRADIGLYDSDANMSGFAFRMGTGDGEFGPLPGGEPLAQYNMQATYNWANTVNPIIPRIGQINADGAADLVKFVTNNLHFRTRFAFNKHIVANDLDAYDYSVHLIKDGSVYKMWTGGRWRTVKQNGDEWVATDAANADRANRAFDGDHILYSSSSDGRNWFRQVNRPVFYNGMETGFTGWWTDNTLEPEVIKVDGTYYMFWQSEIFEGQQVDTGETVPTNPNRLTPNHADRIGLSTSQDGTHWTRANLDPNNPNYDPLNPTAIDRGVVINLPAATREALKLTHEEVVYVPDDPDGKVWWLYVATILNGAESGPHVRLRSNNPYTFDWNDREATTGMVDLGNQIGYADEAPGGRVFFRISFSRVPGPTKPYDTYPSMQVSRDGLNWSMPGFVEGGFSAHPILAGSDGPTSNKNTYFLGMSTIDGTGRLEYDSATGTYHAFYAAATSYGTQPTTGIVKAEIGLGELSFTIQ